MSEPKGEAVFMAVDMRRRRIRIHKTVIHLMGNPKYIQFLVNPEEMVVAIRSVEQDNPGDQTYKVSQRLLTSKSSYEICSSLLIERLCNVMGVFDHEISFRLSGYFVASRKMAVFPLDSFEEIERQGDAHGQ